MTDDEAIQMMRFCKEEILDLRKQVEFLTPRAEAYEQLKAVIGMFPKPSTSMKEDVVWRLDKRIAELQTKEKVDSAD